MTQAMLSKGSLADPNVLPSMRPYEPYVQSLEGFARTILERRELPIERKEILGSLDGRPGARLRDLVPLRARKATGAFFTGSSLASQAMALIAHTIGSESVLFDPACGVGDLLIAAARYLPVDSDLLSTLARWEGQISGFDIHPEFVRGARARLVVLASTLVPLRSVAEGPHLAEPREMLSRVAVGDGVAATTRFREATHILLNPPYNKIPAPVGCDWGSGKVSQAAVFLDKCLEAAEPGARIVAILPDVLRTGSLYAKWRGSAEDRARVDAITVFGAFDAWADVDVFVLHLTVGNQRPTQHSGWWSPVEAGAVGHVGDHFEARVGPVVPHRHKRRGQWHPYLYAGRLPAWGEFEADRTGKRRFTGRTFLPPFVAVRRTSAPSDHQRAVGTVVVGDRPVAVENHLLVLTPKDGRLERCQQLLAVLEDQRTSEWLNERIRCRHLTVGAVVELPWWSDQP